MGNTPVADGAMNNAWVIKLILILMLLVLVAVYRSVSEGRRSMGRFMPLVPIGLAAVVILFPNLTQVVANMVGVTLGASLVVYLTIMGLLIMVVAMRGVQNKQAREITLLARKIALDQGRPATETKTDQA